MVGDLNCFHSKTEGVHYSGLEKPMNSKERQKGMTLKDELPRSVAAQMLVEKRRDITPERLKGWG